MMAHPQEKYALPSPEVVTPMTITTTDLKKKNNISRAVAAIILGVAVVAGVSLCIYFFTKTTADMAEHYNWKCKDSHGPLDQNVENNIQENTALYHIHNITNEQWVLVDFNRNIEVFKIQTPASTSCYAKPLNRSRELTPEEIKVEMEKKAPSSDDDDDDLDQPRAIEDAYYTAYEDLVTDASYLGPRAKDLCGNHGLYWLHASCAGPDSEVESPGTSRRLLWLFCEKVCTYKKVCTGWFIFKKCTKIKSCIKSC